MKHLLIAYLLIAAADHCAAYTIIKKNRRSLTISKLPVSHDDAASSYTTGTRSDFLRNMFAASATIPILASSPRPSLAAPPFAIMAEELGYFPVKDEKSGETVMVPAKAKRESTDQAVELAKYLQSTKAVMYGAFWCPHCQRQSKSCIVSYLLSAVCVFSLLTNSLLSLCSRGVVWKGGLEVYHLCRVQSQGIQITICNMFEQWNRWLSFVAVWEWEESGRRNGIDRYCKNKWL